MKNYYAILGISLFATEAEILHAMRKKAERQEIDLETLNECREHLLLVANRRLYNEQVREHFPLFFKQCNEIFRQENEEKVKAKRLREERKMGPIETWLYKFAWCTLIYYFFVFGIYGKWLAPIVAQYRALNRENIQITCAYINPIKARNDYMITIDQNVFGLVKITSIMRVFPIDYKKHSFVEYMIKNQHRCTKIKYVQVPALYPTFLTGHNKKIYLYDYIE